MVRANWLKRSLFEAERDIVSPQRLAKGREALDEDDQSRLRAAAEVVHNSNLILRRFKWAGRDWSRNGPGGGNRTGYRSAGLVDHAYTLVSLATGVRVYVSEPYGLGPDALREIGQLIDEGWDVQVEADRAIWFPGRTVAVWIWKGGLYE